MARVFSAPIIGQSAASGAQVIDGSLKFDASAYLSRTPSSVGNRNTWTWSGWVKRSDLTTSGNALFAAYDVSTRRDVLRFDRSASGAELNLQSSQGTDTYGIYSNAKLRDIGWYHIVAIYDDTNSTTADKQQLYVNGERLTSVSTENNGQDGGSTTINNNDIHYIGARSSDGSISAQFDGAMAQVYFIDGQALGPEYFGFTDPLTNTWRPKKFSGSFTLSTINDGTVWSNYLTRNDTSQSWTRQTEMFSGTLSDNTTVAGGFYFEPPSDFTGITSLRVYMAIPSHGYTITLNDNTTKTGTGAFSAGWNDLSSEISTEGGTLSKIKFVRNGSGGNVYPYIYALEIDGVILVDSKVGEGTNSFYLPMDGNSPIGQDKSGNGNDWTPVNFGGSVALDNPQVSGAKPILNTTQGGAQAGVGVFGSRENIVYTVTVSNPGSGNKYYLDGVEAPTLSNLVRGATYTFDQSDSSNGSHPLVFGSTAEGNNFARGANYGSISAGTAGAATTITIPYDASETLYYHCSAHSGMGGSIVGIHTNETKADQYASNCVFALPIIGDKEDVSASIACTMSNASITNSGVDFVTTYSNFYGASGDFTGASSDALYTGDDDTKFKMEEEDFTVECWVYSTSSSGTQNVCQIYGNSGSKYYGIYWNGSSLRFYVTGTGGPGDVSAGDMVFGKSRWYHLALVRNGSTLKGYVDGVEVASNSITSDIDETGYQAYVGRHSPANNGFTGYIQDFRVYKGVAKYTSDFVVPSPSPDILPDTPSGVSGNSKLTKITDGAVSFDGTGDYLEIADNADFEMGAGDFTIEAFFYNQENAVQSMITKYGDGVSTRSFWLGTLTSNNPSFYWYNGSNSYNINGYSGSLPLNKWTHVVAQRTSGDIYLFADGKVVASNTGANAAKSFNDTSEPVVIGSDSYASNEQPFQGFISNVRIVKGTGVYNTIGFTPPTRELTNVTNTKLLCCQSNTSATEGAVKPGTITANGNAAATNFNPFNTNINTVRGQESGYCTWNPLAVQQSGHGGFRDGNLEIIASTDGSNKSSLATFAIPSSGKWYWEVKAFRTGGINNGGGAVGVAEASAISATAASGTRLGEANSSSWVFSLNLFDARHRNTADYSNYLNGGSAVTDTGIIGIAVDMDNDKMWAHYNGVYGNAGGIGNPVTGANPAFSGEFSGLELFPAGGIAVDSGSGYIRANWGQKPFKFPPPDGFQPLNTANTRPVKVISRPDQYVGVTTYVGNGYPNSNTQSVQGLNFGDKPDLVWIKQRTETSQNHALFDSIRGPGHNLSSSTNHAERSDHSGSTGDLMSFDVNGFTVGNSEASGARPVNLNGEDIVAWCWKAGGSKGTFNVDGVGYASAAAAGLTGGDITPSGASVGTKQGFSIVKFTGPGSAGFQAVPHGLSEKPKFILCKDLDNARNWGVFHEDVVTADTRAFILNSTSGAFTSGTACWDVSAIDATTFTPYFRDDFGASYGADNIAYLWHDVPGLQKFGIYEGNGAGDGPFVELGFRPALVVCKNFDDTQPWQVYDSKRGPINVIDKGLQWNSSNAEYSGTDRIDFVSNGFKVRGNGGVEPNVSGQTYMYAAWAEAPSIDLYGGGANAR